MAKRRSELRVADMVDYGPAITRDHRGRPVPAAIAAGLGVELADVPDLDRPGVRVTVRVARRADPLVGILDWSSRSGPDASRYMAALQFRRDSAIADGAHGEIERIGVSGGGSNGGPTIARLDAQGRVRRAWLAIRGPTNDAWVAQVITAMVLGFATLEAAQRISHCRRETARERLEVGLDRLADHYGLTARDGYAYKNS